MGRFAACELLLAARPNGDLGFALSGWIPTRTDCEMRAIRVIASTPRLNPEMVPTPHLLAAPF